MKRSASINVVYSAVKLFHQFLSFSQNIWEKQQQKHFNVTGWQAVQLLKY